MATLIADNLTYSYSKQSKPALNRVSVQIKPGTLTALVGPNGAGKSTLLKLLQGINNPDIGDVTIDGESLVKTRSQVALMPQRSSMNWKFPITVENKTVPASKVFLTIAYLYFLLKSTLLKIDI